MEGVVEKVRPLFWWIKNYSLLLRNNEVKKKIMLELERQYQFYLEHEAEFLEKYEGKYLVISESLDVTSFDTKKEAYAFGAENLGLGNFLLQKSSYDATHAVNCMNFNR